MIRFLSSLPKDERPFGLVTEESGKYLPEQLGVWVKAIPREIDACGFQDGHLLVHVHNQWGLQDSTQLECLANGANGIWASLIIQGASMGHSCSTVMLLNLIRLTRRFLSSTTAQPSEKLLKRSAGSPLAMILGPCRLCMVSEPWTWCSACLTSHQTRKSSTWPLLW